ncbi:MAG: hypothetical protein CMO01_28145 [Thalassobius sp.]|nr:hypothetical protein [Thalassovita sp.]
MKKRFFYLLVSGVLLGNMLYAQDQNDEQGERRRRKMPSVEEMAQMQTTQMTDSLALTEDQVAVVGEINLKYAKQRVELMKNEELTREEKSYDMETLEIKKEKELKKILSKDQLNKYKEMEEQRKAQRRNRRGGPPDGGPGGFPPDGPPNGGIN